MAHNGLNRIGKMAAAEPTAIQAPSGRWYLTGGSIPMALAYGNADGSPLTADQIGAIRQAGPGFARPRVGAITFASRDEALAALAKDRKEGR